MVVGAIPSVLFVFLARATLAVGSDVELNDLDDLKKQYYNIFKTGNRNAASHLWASFILDRSSTMSAAQLKTLFKGFCPVSGSPLPDDPHTLYKVQLASVSGDEMLTGVTHHCCWPCICDTSDFIRIDTKTIKTSDGPQKYNVLVIGDPCSHPEKLKQSYVDPFNGQSTLLSDSAPELSCVADGGQNKLKGATYSDNGYPILGIFSSDPEDLSSVAPPHTPHQENDPTFGYGAMCLKRKKESYNSGMGLIFHLVANISPIAKQTDGRAPGRPAMRPVANLQQKDLVQKVPVKMQSEADRDSGYASVSLVALGVLCVGLLAVKLRRSSASLQQFATSRFQMSEFEVLE